MIENERRYEKASANQDKVLGHFGGPRPRLFAFSGFVKTAINLSSDGLEGGMFY